jgi:hypothetical protein
VTTQPSASPRKASANNLNRQAGQYSLAAAFAGVSLLALAQPAAAEVVVTKAHLPVIPLVGVSLDLNHDGVADFYFSLLSYKEFGPSFQCELKVVPARGGGVVASPATFVSSASALVRGARIGPSARFSPSSVNVIIEDSFGNFTNGHTTSRIVIGKWGGNPPNRYLGVKFLIDGETHYGWVRLTVTSSGRALSIRGTITAYAYETEPDKPIYAGTAEEPTAEMQVPENTQNQRRPSLGMLALGADGLLMWRREETLTAK